MYELNKEQIKMLKKEYPRGTRLQLIYMSDLYGVERDTKGTVKSIGRDGIINVKWDNGSTLGLMYGRDRFIKI